jgi:NADH dehydrogenase
MILVTGGTGFIGRHVVARLVADGARVRCLLPADRQGNLPWDAELVDIVTGTIIDEEALYRAANGAHTIIHLESAQWWGRPRDMERVEIVGTRTLISAARSARVGRIITLSHLGAAPSSAFTLLRVKGVVEELIKNGGLAYTILRSGLVYGPDDAFISHIGMMLALNPLFFVIPGHGEGILHPIYIDDLVNAIVASLDTIDSVDRVIEVGGAEYTTLDDMIRTIMRVTRKQRTVIHLPPYMLRWITAFSSRIFPRSLMTQQWMDMLAASRTARIGSIYDNFGLHPRRFEDTLLSYLPKQSFFFKGLRYRLRRRPRGV